MSPKPVDPLAAVVADWNEDRAPSPFEKLMWRTEVRPMLRSTGMLLELLDHAPDHERESGLALGAPVTGFILLPQAVASLAVGRWSVVSARSSC